MDMITMGYKPQGIPGFGQAVVLKCTVHSMIVPGLPLPHHLGLLGAVTLGIVHW